MPPSECLPPTLCSNHLLTVSTGFFAFSALGRITPARYRRSGRGEQKKSDQFAASCWWSATTPADASPKVRDGIRTFLPVSAACRTRKIMIPPFCPGVQDIDPKQRLLPYRRLDHICWCRISGYSGTRLSSFSSSSNDTGATLTGVGFRYFGASRFSNPHRLSCGCNVRPKAELR